MYHCYSDPLDSEDYKCSCEDSGESMPYCPLDTRLVGVASLHTRVINGSGLPVPLNVIYLFLAVTGNHCDHPQNIECIRDM